MEKNNHSKLLRQIIGVASASGLMCVFIFQQFDFANLIAMDGKPLRAFFINRTFRFLLNDGLMVAIIWSLFYKKKYVVFALWVQVFGFVFVLTPYFVFKANFPSYNGPMLSFMHRLILNPTLLLLLIPAFYYQEMIQDNEVDR